MSWSGRLPWVDPDDGEPAADLEVADALVSWSDVAQRPRRGVSVVMPAGLATPDRVAAAHAEGDDVEVVIVGTDACDAAGVRTVAAAARTPALLVAAGASVASGWHLVVVDTDPPPRPGWLRALREALDDETVAAAGPAASGRSFPRGGGLPMDSRAEGDHLGVRAVAGPGILWRLEDLARIGGLDPRFGGELAQVDACLRLLDERTGGCRVVPSAQVGQGGDTDPRPGFDRRLMLDRWGDLVSGDDHLLHRARGADVLGYRPVPPSTGVPRDQRLWTSEAVLAPADPASPRVEHVAEAPPRLRWAIKNPAPAGAQGDTWGDTPFAHHLAAALGRLGQDTRIDRRPDFHTRDSWRDEVVLLLRGRSRCAPAPDQVSLLWLISHPEMVGSQEWRGWDRVYAASTTWATAYADRTGAPCEPLLQCTDPAVFHPDLAQPDTGEELLFVGNARGVRRPMVAWSIEGGLPLAVHGSGWDGLVPTAGFRGAYLPNDRVGAAYRSAGVVLNDHWEDMRVEGFLSNRLFDAVACGARVVSDDVAGLREIFGSSVQVAHDPADLRRLVSASSLDDVFGDDTARRAQADEVHRLHSFDARAARLLDDAVRISRDRALRRMS